MSTDPTKKKDDHVSTSKALDDEQRVKVLSPGMLVAKRFFRNKLAVAGLVILVAMFLFSFIGGMVSPYNESQVFRKTDHVWKDYAGATYNKSYIFTTANGAEFPAQGQQKFILATNSGKEDALCEKAVKDLQIKTPNVEIDSGNLSGGNQQKVVVGKWLARDSRVVIFDEPTRGIDVGAKVEIYNLMNELKKQGIAVMFVSSEMPEVMGIADRIIVMCDGRITGEVSAREATQDEILTMATSFENKSIKETEGGSKNE